MEKVFYLRVLYSMSKNIIIETERIQEGKDSRVDILTDNIKLEFENKLLTFPLWDKQIIGSKLLPNNLA